MGIKIPTLADTIVANKGRYYGAAVRFAVPDIFLVDKSTASAIDRCTTNSLALSATGGASLLGRFAVPCVRLADKPTALHTDRCTTR